MNKHIKRVLGLVILVTTAALFTFYLNQHPGVIKQLRAIPLNTIVVLLGLYAIAFLAFAMVTRGLLQMYHKHMNYQENLLFNAYSSLINFFGPGQSGPIFRGAYLKKKHNLSVKQYMFTLLIYYGFYAVISAVFMFIGNRPWWQTALLALIVGVLSLKVIQYYKRRSKVGQARGFSLINIGWILGATLLQLVVMTIIYGLELHRAGAEASISQVLAYSGVANFALFVSLTPGAIGIREAFLLLSQGLHHIDSSTIVAASVIDRAVYLLFLGLLFVVVVGLHAKKKLDIISKVDKA